MACEDDCTAFFRICTPPAPPPAPPPPSLFTLQVRIWFPCLLACLLACLRACVLTHLLTHPLMFQVGIWFPISTFVAIGLEHSVANLFILPLGHQTWTLTRALPKLNLGPLAIWAGSEPIRGAASVPVPHRPPCRCTAQPRRRLPQESAPRHSRQHSLGRPHCWCRALLRPRPAGRALPLSILYSCSFFRLLLH